jgi:hypothetical protein
MALREAKLCSFRGEQGIIRQPPVILLSLQKEQGGLAELGQIWRGGPDHYQFCSVLFMVLVDLILAELVLNAVYQGVPTRFNHVRGDADRTPDFLIVP